MPPCSKPAYQTLRISLDQAWAEVALLRVQMYRFGAYVKTVNFKDFGLLVPSPKLHSIQRKSRKK